MEFREYYRGICAKIRFDSGTSTYIGELDGLPARTLLKADSYEDLQASFKQAVDDHMAGKTPNLQEEHWVSANQLEKTDISKEAAELEAAMAAIAAEMEKTSK